MVEQELASAGFDPSQISGGGLKITTTFDKDAAGRGGRGRPRSTPSRPLTRRGQKASKLHAAIASVDVGSGEVLALYGGPDYVKNSRNWATTPRPTASTFKAYALAAGLKDGFSLRSTLQRQHLHPAGRQHHRSATSTPTSTARGDLLKATADSINTAFVDLTTQMDDGPDKIIELAEAAGAPEGRRLGRQLPDRRSGTAEVSPLNQASAYATFANDGIARRAATWCKEVTRRRRQGGLQGRIPRRSGRSASDVAHDVTYALTNVVEQGTGRSVQTLNRPVAGKTGTKDVESDDIVSAWFVAYTKQISTAVMYVAGDGGNADLDAYRRPGRQHLLRRHLPGADLGRLHGRRRPRASRSKQFDAAGVREPRRRPAADRHRAADPDPTRTREPTTEAPTQHRRRRRRPHSHHRADRGPSRSARAQPTTADRPDDASPRRT